MTRRTTMDMVPDLLAERCATVPESGCWLWLPPDGSGGYGVIRVESKAQKAHRVSWRVHRGPIPDGMSVLHKCDTPQCINPDHLFLGTQAENVIDMVSKGRCQRWMRGRFGSKSPLAKMTDAEAVEIRALHALGRSQHSLARQFGRSPMTINRLVRNISWKNL